MALLSRTAIFTATALSMHMSDKDIPAMTVNPTALIQTFVQLDPNILLQAYDKAVRDGNLDLTADEMQKRINAMPGQSELQKKDLLLVVNGFNAYFEGVKDGKLSGSDIYSIWKISAVKNFAAGLSDPRDQTIFTVAMTLAAQRLTKLAAGNLLAIEDVKKTSPAAIDQMAAHIMCPARNALTPLLLQSDGTLNLIAANCNKIFEKTNSDNKQQPAQRKTAFDTMQSCTLSGGPDADYQKLVNDSLIDLFKPAAKRGRAMALSLR